MNKRQQISTTTCITVIVITLLLSVAFLQRLLPITSWNAFPGNYTVEGEAILSNVDGYYYLNTAKELLEGEYSPVETHRAIPDTITRSPIPPLIGVITAALSQLTGFSINWTAAILPAVFSLLIAAPLIFIGYRYGGPIAAVVATASCLLAPANLVRNNFGFFDTDCLNPFFALSCAALFLLFAVTKNRRRYLYLLAGLFCAALFFWWWDQSFAPPMFLGLGPLGMALLFFYRPKFREGMFFFAIVLLFCAVGTTLIGFEAFFSFPERISQLFLHISKSNPAPYPKISAGIGEQAAMGWRDFALNTFAFTALFPLALAGLFFFFYRAKKELFLFLPILLVCAFTFFFARRFVIFAVPVFSLGLGIIFSELYCLTQKTKKRWLTLGYGVCAGALIVTVSWKNFQNTPEYSPLFTQPSLAGMKALQKTEENAVIWSWWDQGHPLVYWAGRDTVNDGMVHDSERTYCTAVPLVAQNDRFAANFMNFYITQGKTGRQQFLQLAETYHLDGDKIIEEMLTAGPKQAKELHLHLPQEIRTEMLQLLFPQQERTIYLFLDMRQTNMTWIHLFGSWNMASQQWQKILPTVTFTPSEEIWQNISQGNLPNNKELHVEDNSFLLHSSISEQPIALTEIVRTSSTESSHQLAEGNVETHNHAFKKGIIAPEKEHYYTSTGQYSLDINLQSQILMLRDKNLANGLSNRLFWRHKDYDSRYFVPVELNQPLYQIWRVESDMLPARN